MKDCDKTISEEEFFDQLGEDLNDNMYFAASGVSKNGIVFSVPFTETGIYYFRAIRSDKSSSDSAYYRFSMVSDTEKKEFVNKVFNTDGSDWAEIVEKYVDNYELLTYRNVLNIDALKADGFSDILVKTREFLFETEDTEDAETEKEIGDVNTLVNAAILMSEFYAGEFEKAEEGIAQCSALSEKIGKYASFERFTTVLKDLLNKEQTAEETLKVLQHSAMLSYIQGGTADDIAKALEEYGEELGISTADCEKSGVELSRVAARISNAKASDYFGDGLSKTYDEAIAAEKAQKTETESKKKSAGGGGGGGGGGVGVAPIITPVVSVPKDDSEEIPTVEPNTDDELTFTDLVGFEWSRSEIKTLCDKGVIKGYSDEIFNPSANVSRAEFVKMLVTGLEIAVSEKKEMHFIDCTGDDWFYPYVAVAYSTGIVSGVDEYHFDPLGCITRQDMSVMISNALSYKGKSAVTSEEINIKEEVSDYADKPFNAMIGIGILKGYEDGSYKPFGLVSRAEAAVVLCRIIDLINGGIN